MSSNKKKIAFYTLGCRANQYQTDVLKSKLATRNLELATFTEEADIYVINTCTVTHDAERKSRQAIRRALRQNPKAKIIVAGCYAKLETKKIQELFPSAEIFSSETFLAQAKAQRIRQNLMVQDGCEHFCSYCIVPYARGKIKSKPIETVLAEAQQLVAQGAREIILTGINLGTHPELCSVITALNSIDDLVRIRLSSIEPMYLTKELIDTIAATAKVCNFLHIPLQSGDNTILKAMNRNYTTDDYFKLIEYARDKMPECGISTDIIVGFPGEGEKEYQNTVKLVKQIKFSRIHIFSYSKRKGTPAAKFPNQVEEKVKKDRNKYLHQLKDKYMLEFANQYIGQEVEILVEQKGNGLTTNFVRCVFDDAKDLSGHLIKVRPLPLKVSMLPLKSLGPTLL